MARRGPATELEGGLLRQRRDQAKEEGGGPGQIPEGVQPRRPVALTEADRIHKGRGLIEEVAATIRRYEVGAATFS